MHQRRQLDIRVMARVGVHRRMSVAVAVMRRQCRRRVCVHSLARRSRLSRHRLRLRTRNRCRLRLRAFRVMAMSLSVMRMRMSVRCAVTFSVMAFAQLRQRRRRSAAPALKVRVLQRLRRRGTLFGVVKQHFLQ